MTRRAVLVTGAGWTTALGADLSGVWQRLLSGATGIRPVPSAVDLRSPLAAPLPAVRASDRVTQWLSGSATQPPSHSVTGSLGGSATERQVALAAETAAAALRDAGREPGEIGAVVAGSSLGPHLDDPVEAPLHGWLAAVADRLGADLGPAGLVPVSTACSSGADAVLTAAALVSTGAVDRCLAGGVDLLSDAKRLGHSALGTMSPTTIRPFGADRDGTVVGEGAAFLVLEAAQSAEPGRGWGTVRGWGSSNDAAGPTAPDGTAAAATLAVRRALRRAGVTPGEIAVVNAHGTGTPANDAVEAACYAAVFGPGERPALFASKPAFGHTLGATGAVEAIALLLALHHQVVPPTASGPPMAGLPLPLPAAPTPVTGTLGLSLTLGFGGFNTCLVLERGARR